VLSEKACLFAPGVEVRYARETNPRVGASEHEISKGLPVFEKIRMDFNRHGRKLTNPAIWVLGVYRYGAWANQLSGPTGWAAKKVHGALDLCVQLTTGSFIPPTVEAGEGLHLIHPFCIRIHPEVRIGKRVGIMHEVTLATTMTRKGVPIIGDDVFIGVGAKIMGPVKIGDGAVIAPNSLVLSNVPAGATAMGVPAKVRMLPPEFQKKKNVNAAAPDDAAS